MGYFWDLGLGGRLPIGFSGRVMAFVGGGDGEGEGWGLYFAEMSSADAILAQALVGVFFDFGGEETLT